MLRNISTPLTLILLVLVGCRSAPSDQTKAAASTRLKRTLIKEEFGKGNFLSTSFGIYFQQFLYVPDQTANRVFKLDHNLEPALMLGQSGEGPGGLAGPNFVFADQGRILVDTGATRRIATFDTAGHFLNATPVSNYKRMTRFAAYDDMLFLSSPSNDHPYSVVDMDGNFLFGFGAFRFDDQARFRVSRNLNHILLSEIEDQPILISVSLSEPEIDLFDLDGKRLSGLNYKDLPQARNRLESVETFYQTSGPNQTRALIVDVCHHDNQLYLLLHSAEKPFQLLHFEMKKSAVTYLDTLTIQDDIFPLSLATDGTSFYILEGRTNYLFVYERSDSP